MALTLWRQIFSSKNLSRLTNKTRHIQFRYNLIKLAHFTPIYIHNFPKLSYLNMNVNLLNILIHIPPQGLKLNLKSF